MSDAPAEPTSARNFPGPETFQTAILDVLREQLGWIAESTLLERVDAHLRRKGHSTHPPAIRRSLLSWALRRDERCERRQRGDGAFPEYRASPEWPARSAAVLLRTIESRRAAGMDRFVGSEHVAELRQSVGLLYHECTKRYAPGNRGRWTASQAAGYDALYHILKGLGWNPEAYWRDERASGEAPVRATVPAPAVDRLVTALRLIAGEAAEQLEAVPPRWITAVDDTVSWLRDVVDRFVSIASERSSGDEQRTSKCDGILEEWSGVSVRLKAADTTRRIDPWCEATSAILGEFAEFAAEWRDDENETVVNRRTTLALRLRDAWCMLAGDGFAPAPEHSGAAGASSESKLLTVTAAAKLLMVELPYLTIGKARARVSAAASRGSFKTNDRTGSARRIDVDSFSTWRIRQRDKSFDEEDGEEEA